MVEITIVISTQWFIKYKMSFWYHTPNTWWSLSWTERQHTVYMFFSQCHFCVVSDIWLWPFSYGMTQLWSSLNWIHDAINHVASLWTTSGYQVLSFNSTKVNFIYIAQSGSLEIQILFINLFLMSRPEVTLARKNSLKWHEKETLRRSSNTI